MAREVKKAAGRLASITTGCVTLDEFTATFRSLCSATTIFLPANEPLGKEQDVRYAVALCGDASGQNGKVVLRGTGSISECFLDSNNPYHRAGMLLELGRLDAMGRILLRELNAGDRAGDSDESFDVSTSVDQRSLEEIKNEEIAAIAAKAASATAGLSAAALCSVEFEEEVAASALPPALPSISPVEMGLGENEPETTEVADVESLEGPAVSSLQHGEAVALSPSSVGANRLDPTRLAAIADVEEEHTAVSSNPRLAAQLDAIMAASPPEDDEERGVPTRVATMPLVPTAASAVTRVATHPIDPRLLQASKPQLQASNPQPAKVVSSKTPDPRAAPKPTRPLRPAGKASPAPSSIEAPVSAPAIAAVLPPPPLPVSAASLPAPLPGDLPAPRRLPGLEAPLPAAVSHTPTPPTEPEASEPLAQPAANAAAHPGFDEPLNPALSSGSIADAIAETAEEPTAAGRPLPSLPGPRTIASLPMVAPGTLGGGTSEPVAPVMVKRSQAVVFAGLCLVAGLGIGHLVSGSGNTPQPARAKVADSAPPEAPVAMATRPSTVPAPAPPAPPVVIPDAAPVIVPDASRVIDAGLSIDAQLALALVDAAPADAAPEVPLCEFFVELTPADTQILVAGVPIVVSDGKASLGCGAVAFSVEHPDHEAHLVDATLVAGAPYTLHYSFSQEMVSLRVLSTPRKAWVQIDGVGAGKTPLRRNLPSDKVVKIRISKAGFKPVLRTITPTEAVTVDVTLRRFAKKKARKRGNR